MADASPPGPAEDRVVLVRHAATAETRRGAFPATSGHRAVAVCAPLDAAGRAAAAALAGVLPVPDRVWVSAAQRCAETAAAAGLVPDEVVADLAECDFGAWAGLTSAEVAARDGDGLAAWYADPDRAPHGGETLGDLRRRVRRVLARAGALGGTTVAVTSGGVVKAAVMEVLGVAADAVWRIDAACASVTELVAARGPGGSLTWRLRRLGWTPALERQPVGAGAGGTP